jgi:hypothetical protein
MSIKNRIQNFMERHDLDSTDVAIGVISFGGLALSAGLVYRTVRIENAKALEVDSWIADQYEQGRHVFELADGGYLATSDVRLDQVI